MYIFGGKDDENNKLNDLWKYDFTKDEWEFIDCPADIAPTARSGHTASMYLDKYMIIYGGIFEITKELNDMHIFDIQKREWICLFEEINSPAKKPLRI